jgi:hypothetical protein
MDWSYVAGFFDGEGNIHVIKSRNYKNGNNSFYIMIRIYQGDINVLEQIRAFMGYGKIYKYSNKSAAELTFNRKKDVKDFLMNIKDKVFVKKQQVEYVLNNYVFERGGNMSFDIDKFRESISRRNVDKLRKHHTIFREKRLTD